MDFELTQEQVMFRQVWREVVQRELVPLVDDAENNRQFPIEFYRKLGKLGYLCIGLSQEYGGLGLGMVEQVIYAEEIARVCSGIVDAMGAPDEVAILLTEHGNDELRSKYLTPVTKGEKLPCIAVTEPNAGSDSAGMETTAVKEGDAYIINGPKTFITNAPIADFAVIAARTDKTVKPSRGISLIIVDTDTPGFSKPRNLDKMGKHAAMVGEFTMQNCRVPVSNLIGEEGRGLSYVLGAFNARRIINATQSMGIAEAAHEAAVEYAKNRVQFGQPIGKFQAISFRLAHLAAEIESLRWLIYRATWLYDQGRDCIMEASMVKLLGADVSQRVTDFACQVHGGYGYMKEYPVERFFRDARAQSLAVGTSEIQELVIARQLGL